MDTIKLWGRNGEAVRQAMELGELVHLDTASEELTDEFLWFAIQSGLRAKWAEAFPDPRAEPDDWRVVETDTTDEAARLLGVEGLRDQSKRD